LDLKSIFEGLLLGKVNLAIREIKINNILEKTLFEIALN